MKQLNETINWMKSDDYKKRFKAEYYQTKIRYEKLHWLINKYDANKLDFQLSTGIEMLRMQQRCMGEYLHILEVRSLIENIEL